MEVYVVSRSIEDAADYAKAVHRRGDNGDANLVERALSEMVRANDDGTLCTQPSNWHD